MKYPWRGIIVDGIKLNREQQKQFLKDISEQMRANRKLRRSSFLWHVTVIPFILVGAAIGGFLGMNTFNFTIATRLPLLLVLNGSLGFLACLLSVRLHRHIFVRQMRQVMQSLGYVLCLACGYWLKGLDDTTDHCPECGTKREPLPESTPEERDALT